VRTRQQSGTQQKKIYEKEGMRCDGTDTAVARPPSSPSLPLFGNPAISFEILGFASPPRDGFAISELFDHKSRATPMTRQPY
jgi:hypothetical protein